MGKKVSVIFLILGIILIGLGVTLTFVGTDKYYTVIFDTGGGTTVASQKVLANETVKVPDAPTKNEYIFEEWQLNGVKYNFATKVTKNIILKAYWLENNEGKVFVTFDTDGGSLIGKIKLNKDGVVSKPLDPTKEGYEFVNWILNDKEYDFKTPVTSDITLLATWKKVYAKYTVTFDTDGGSTVASVMVTEGTKLTLPKTAPTKKGYLFKEWQLDGVKYDPNTLLEADITLKAVWDTTYIVSFNSDGGNAVKAQTIIKGNKAVAPVNPTQTDKIFVEWQLNGVKYDFTKAVNTNITLKAKWRDLNNYTVTFDTDGGNSIPNGNVVEGGKAAIPTNPTQTGKVFVEWQLNNVRYDFNTVLTGNITLKAKWRDLENYTVIYDTDGGNSIPNGNVVEGGKAAIPTNPTQTGKVFVEWQLNNVRYDFNTVLTGNITLKAKWRNLNNYTVIFDTDGGNSIPNGNVVEGGKATRPDDPTKNNYQFVEWQLSNTTYDFNTILTDNITLTAIWQAIE